MSWNEDSFERFLEYKASVQKAPKGGARFPLDANRINPPQLSLPNNTSQSQYSSQRLVQPPSVIADISDSNWFSPNQPIAPYGPPGISRPWEWDYPTSYNLAYVQPQIAVMKMLRTMRASWGVLATVISTRKDQLLSVPYTFQNRSNPKKKDKYVEEITNFFLKPDGFRRYRAWARLVLDDVLVVDTPCLFFPRNRGGKPLAAERIDPLTIFPLIDDIGRSPETDAEVDSTGISYLRRQPAFQQIIKGVPLLDLDASELMYAPMNPRADFPIFGYPPTEQILRESLEAILKTNYQVSFWDQGTIPELIVTVPDNWSPNQIAVFKAHFDALMSGNLGERTKMHFLPGGMKPFELRNASGQNLWSQRDETLIRICCYAYSVSPAPFIQMMNRSSAQNVQQASKEEGNFPFMSFWKYDIMDTIIQEQFGYDDIEFVFSPPTEPDAEKREKIFDLQLKNGSRNRDEVRAERGEEPIEGGDAYLIQVGNGIVPVADAAGGAAMPMQSAGPGETNAPGFKPDASKKPENVPVAGSPRPPAGQASTLKVSKDELRAEGSRAAGDFDLHSSRRLEAGNYQKGHLKLHGLDISIENSKGSFRGKRDENGKTRWRVKMPAHYGYIRKTEGADGDHVDVFVGPKLDSDRVWIVDQSKHKDLEKFDEHKCFVGYKSLKKVLKDYSRARHDGLRCAASVCELSIDEFKSWLKNGDTKAPIGNQSSSIVYSNSPVQKSGTISSSTGLSSTEILSAPRKRKKKDKSSRSLDFLKGIKYGYGNA